MKTIGIVGGIGPETTVVYYRLLIAAGHTRVIIDSIDAGTFVPLVTRQDLAAVAGFLHAELTRLAAAGAEIGLIAANTPHMAFDAVRAQSPIPLVSIVEATAAHAVERGFRKVALFGTRMTMDGAFFPDVFSGSGIEIVRPEAAERQFIHDKYMGELFRGVIRDDTRRDLLAIVEAVAAREGIDAVILGGTELSLILTEPDHRGVPLVDTTRVHVDAALAAARDAGPAAG